jgi:hypothetical protein
MNEKPQVPKRRVNPMLLLGVDADSAQKKGTDQKDQGKAVGGLKKESQPPLMDATDFEKPSVSRRAFPSSGINVKPDSVSSSEVGEVTPAVVEPVEKVEVKPVARKAVRVPVSGFNPFPRGAAPLPASTPIPAVKSTPTLTTAAKSTVKAAVAFPKNVTGAVTGGDEIGLDDSSVVGGLSPLGHKKEDSEPVLSPAAVEADDVESTVEAVAVEVLVEADDVELVDTVPAVEVVEPPVVEPPVVAPPVVAPPVVAPPAILSVPVDTVDDDVEIARPVARKVNPMFLAGEERDVPDASNGTRGPSRVIRPNFILNGEKPTLPSLPKRDVGDNARKLFETLPEGMAKPRPQNARKIEANINLEDWSDDTSSDTGLGLGGELDEDYVEPQYSKAFHLTERDLIMMRFLARYRYAYTDQLARLVDGMPKNIIARLRVLEKRGFIRKQPITDRQYLWVTRKAGNLLVDINFPEIRKGSLSYATIAHTIGIANLGVELEREAGGRDLLGEGKGLENWEMPMNRWKFGIWGNPEGRVQGEMTVTEREVRQGQLRWRGGRSSVEMRQLVSLASSTLDPVELEEGQEGLFVVYGAGGKGGEHIPDLVVARERGDGGKPEHIAIELELTPKSPADWKRILRNYRDNGEMYSKVYYFTHKRSISTGIQKANEEVKYEGLVVRKYVPINSNIPFWG